MSKTLTYLFDPLCGWCYGASPALASIVESTGVGLELLPTGLFAGHGARPMDMSLASHAWTNDQRIEEITGQIFSLTYRDQVLCNLHQPMDSTAATLALTAVAQTQPQREFEALQRIQRARYVDGCNITELATLCELLRGLGLCDAATRLQAATPELHAATNQRIDRACTLMNGLAARGVPGFVIQDDGEQRLLPSSMLFSQPMHFARQVCGISQAELDNLL